MGQVTTLEGEPWELLTTSGLVSSREQQTLAWPCLLGGFHRLSQSRRTTRHSPRAGEQ